MNIDSKILDNLSTAVIVFNDELRVQYLNQTAESLLAISVKHALGASPKTIIACDDDTLASLVDAATESQSVSKRGVRIRTAGGEDITVDCMINSVHDESGSSFTIVELQQIDRQLRILKEKELLNQHAVTRDVVRGLAHEIKNPLGGLRGAAQLLEAELPEPELREYTQVIIEEADRLQALVNRMLGPNRRPVYQLLNIHDVLERVRKLSMAEVGDSINIKRDYDPSIPELLGDMDQLIQAVLNIVGNAIRALDDDGEIILKTRVLRNFTLGNERHRLIASIEVVDNGPGIPTEIADTLFFPMVTSTDGMGLGLSITQSLITQHKGIVECRSKPGKTVFTILLPLDTQPTAVQKK